MASSHPAYAQDRHRLPTVLRRIHRRDQHCQNNLWYPLLQILRRTKHVPPQSILRLGYAGKFHRCGDSQRGRHPTILQLCALEGVILEDYGQQTIYDIEEQWYG